MGTNFQIQNNINDVLQHSWSCYFSRLCYMSNLKNIINVALRKITRAFTLIYTEPWIIKYDSQGDLIYTEPWIIKV